MKKYRNWSNGCKGFIFITIGLLLLVCQLILDVYWTDDKSKVIRGIVFSLKTTVASILIVSAFWEWVAKVSFVHQLQKEQGMTQSVIKSGIIYYESSYKNINWNQRFDNNNKLTVYVRFGDSWKNYHRANLENHVKKGKKIKIILPNFENKEILQKLVYLYPKDYEKKNTTSKIKTKLKQIAKDYLDIGCEVLLYDGVPNFSYYELENSIIVTFYSEDSKNSPAIELNGGSFYDFCKRELNEAKSNAKIYNE